MENANRWYFTKDELANTPSRKCGIDANKELSYRQQAANFIQDMGQRLQVTQLCINTAIVYMHRFYVFHSFSEVHRNSLSVAALFLAAKVEEQPRKLEHVIKVAHVCLHKDSPPLDVRSDAYAEKQFEVVAHENVLLQTLGFVLAIEHPHTYVVKVCQLVKASKELAQTSYFMATTSLHMTTMCLQYRPTVVACVCIHLACKWSSWKIEPCSEGNEWYYYVDKSVTLDLLETLTQEFIAILETSPHKFKRCTKFNAQKEASSHVSKNSIEYNFKQQVVEQKPSSVKKEILSPGPSTSQGEIKVENCEKPVTVPAVVMQPSPKRPKQPSHSISIDAYREKKEKERIEQAVLTKSLPEPEKDAANVFSSEKAPKNSQSVVSEPQLSNKVNHEVLKALSPVKFSKKEVKSTSLKIPSCVSNDPVVVLERVDVRTELEIPKKSEVGHLPRPESQNLHPAKSDRPKDLAVPKSKHSKPKPNSVPNSHGSPKRNSATNGSKDVELSDRKSSAETNRIEKKEKHKSKSKDKSLTNHSEHSNPSIKVKIRKDIIVLPEKSTSDKPLKIKLPKPPVSTPLKLVITKDKSGSGSYCTSHKNDKKRTHSPGSNEPSSKHARMDHSTPSGGKSGKHLGNDLSAERGSYNHVSYHPSPGAVHRGRTDSNPPLPPIPPPQPPPPPE